MKIVKIKVGYGRTYNLGNYQSRRIDCELEAEINQVEGVTGPEDHRAVTEELFEVAKQHVADQQIQVEAEAKAFEQKKKYAKEW